MKQEPFSFLDPYTAYIYYVGLKNVYLQKIFVYCNCRDEQMHNKNMLWFINNDDVWNFRSEIQACKQCEITP